jgi:hypothetical protein
MIPAQLQEHKGWLLWRLEPSAIVAPAAQAFVEAVMECRL